MNSELLFERYSRQIFIDEIGVAGQRKILNAKVLVVGAGGLGSPVIQYLAAAGVGNLAVADFDTVEIHNLNRQIIHTEQSVGSAKVASAEKFVKRLNSHVKFRAIGEKINPKNAEKYISAYDLIIDGSDNFTCRYFIGQCIVHYFNNIQVGHPFSDRSFSFSSKMYCIASSGVIFSTSFSCKSESTSFSSSEILA